MNKKKISNVASTAFLLLGGVFALQVLISNVSAATNRVNMADEKEGDYISGIMDQQNTKDEVDALFVGDVCIFSESGYFDNKVGTNGYTDKDAKTVRINCDGVVPGIVFDKETRTLTFDNYTGNEKIIFFDTKKTEKKDFNIKVYGENKSKGITFYEYVKGDKQASVNVSGGGTLDGGVSVQSNWSIASSKKYNVFLNVGNVVINGGVYSDGSLSLNNSKVSSDSPYTGVIAGYDGFLYVKNSDIDIKNIGGGGGIEIENSDFKSTLGPIIVGGSYDIKIKNSNLKIENTNEIPTVSKYGDSLPMMFVYPYASPFPVAAWYSGGALTESSPNLINIEDVKVRDNLENDLKVVSKTVVFDDEQGSGSYVAYVFGTDETGYNEETEMWENFPQVVEITAEKPELVGAKIVKEEKTVNKTTDSKATTPEEKGDILEGAGQEMNMNEIKDLVIRYNRSYIAFNGVAFDGKMLTLDNFTVESGSTIVTIKADFLKTQKAGEHTVSAYFIGEDRPIETTVTLKVKSAGNQGSLTTSEEVSSESSLGILFAVLSAIMVGAGVSLKIRGRNTISKRYF